MSEPHKLLAVTVREAAEMVGLSVPSVYRLMLAARRRGEPVTEGRPVYVVAPGKRIGAWAKTYYFGSLLRAVRGVGGRAAA